MSKYTPTTEEVKESFAHNPPGDRWHPSRAVHREAFDRWIAEAERAAAEKAWDEGLSSAIEAEIQDRGYGDTQYPGNPYREGQA